MKTYTNNKVYKIYDMEYPEQFYIGSTHEIYLSKRLQKHRMKSKTCPERKIYKYILSRGWDSMKIELVELFTDAMTTEQLRQKEGGYIRTLKPTLNCCIAGRRREEYVEHVKEKQNSKHVCDVCNGRYTLKNKAQHLKTKLHLSHINQAIEV